MNDSPTLREVAQAFRAWFATQSQMGQDWLSSLGDIHVNTIGAVIMIGFAIVFIAVFFAWLIQLCDFILWYRALGYPRLRALRLAQADIEDERIRQQQQHNPYYQGQRSGFAATPADREAWAQDLAEERRLHS